MERIKKKLNMLEQEASRLHPVRNLIFYDPGIKGDGDRRLAEFLKEHPEFLEADKAVFLYPKRDDETLAHHYAAMPERMKGDGYNG